MTQTVTPEWAAANAKLSRTPKYKIAIFGVTQQYGTHRTPTGCKPYMSLPTSQGAIVKPQKGQSSLGTVSFSLNDHDNEITALLPLINGALVQVFGGFDTLLETKWATCFTGIVTDCNSNTTNTGYDVTLSDLQQLINKQVCQVTTSVLTQAMSAAPVDQWIHYVRIDPFVGAYNYTPGDYPFTSPLDDVDWAASFAPTLTPGMTWSYYQPSVFVNGLTVNLPSTAGILSGGTRYVLIDSEIISFTTVGGTTLTGSTRGALGTQIALHAVGAKVTELLRITGHPGDIFLGLLTNTDKTGASIPSALINTAAITAFKAAFNPTMTMDFRILAPMNLKTFLENEIFAVLAAYLTLTGSGLISLKQFAIPVTPVQALTHDNIRRTSSATDINGQIALAWKGNYSSIYNQVQYQYDYDGTTKQYNTTSLIYEDSDSVSRYGAFPLLIQSQGLRSDSVLLSTVLAAVASLILERYSSGGAPIVNASVFLSLQTIEAGDIISITSTVLPNPVTGLKGVVGALFEVISRGNSWAAGSVDLQLLWTSWNL